jgi:hypothetical protein
MGLKKVNHDSNNVVVSNLNKANFFSLKIVRIEFKIKDHMLSFLQDVVIANKNFP